MNDKPNASPSPAGDNGGRAPGGRFGPGNRFGKGNPNNKKIQQLRNALLQSITVQDIRKAAKKLLEQAANGDRLAFAELCDRVLGRPAQSDLLERLERLEQAVADREEQGDLYEH